MIIGIEIDRGLLVDSLVGAGYCVYAVNPLAASRYRDRHTTSGAKSDAGDAKLLADLVRTDRHNHRPVAGDTDEASAIRVPARAHQALIWARQRQVNALRSALRDYFPAAREAFGTDLAQTDALAILSVAPTPERARARSRAKIAAALRRAGRQRNIERRAIELQMALRAAAWWCWRGWRATDALVTPVCGGSSARSVKVPARGATTTRYGPAARPTPRRPASWPIAGWAFSTRAWSGARPTENTSPGLSVRRCCAWSLDSSSRGMSSFARRRAVV